MKFKKNILGTILWRGIYFVTVLLLNIIIARYFKAASSGWIYYIVNYFSFIILLASFSLESGITFFAAGNTISRHKLSGFAFLWSILVTILIVLLLSLFYQQPAPLFSRRELIFFSGIYTFGILLTTFFNALFYANQDFELPNLLLTVTNIFLMFAAFLIVTLSSTAEAPHRFLQAFFFNFMVQGLVLSGAYLIKNKFWGLWLLPGARELKLLFRYAFFALFANLVFFLLYRVDYWFVKNSCAVCKESDLGNYIQVSKLGQMFLIVPSMIANILFPRMAAGFGKEVNDLLPVLCRVIFFLYLMIMVPVIAGGQWLFPFVFGATFSQMYVPFLLLMPGILALSSVAFVSAYYAGKNKVIVNLKGSFFALMVVVTGDICFIPYFGIKAAAAISSLAYLACYFYILLIFKKDYAVPLKYFFIPARGDFKKAYGYIVQQFKDVL